MKGPIARATLRTTAVFALRLLLQALTLLLVTHLLGPAAYGAFAGVMGLAVFFGALAGCGMPLMQIRAISRDGGQGAGLPYAAPAVLLVGTVLLLFFVPLCSFALPESALGVDALLALGLAELIMQPLLMLYAAERHGRGEVARAQLLQVLPLALRALAAGVVVAASFDSPLSAYAFAYLLATLTALAVARSGGQVVATHRWRFPCRDEWAEACGYAATDLSRNGPTELDKAVAARSMPAYDAGLYAAAARIMAAGVLPVMAMVVSALPRLFRESVGPELWRLVALMAMIALFYGSVLSALFWVGAGWIDIILGAAYIGIGDVLRSMCVIIPGVALRLVSGSVLMALGRPWMRVGAEFFGVIILVCVGVGLPPYIGSTGMVIALAFSEWGMALVSSALVIKVLVSCRDSDAIRKSEMESEVENGDGP
ncbi:MAG: polysaccharide biosynthesis protein [Stenotrophomonas sp.]|jgi:O-antigen/teichoic acid export membrane protein|nr:MAG: polysaccharide biosynthesis protein [Stenotrophomonas sp.]